MTDDPQSFLAPTECVNHTSDEVASFIDTHRYRNASERETAVRLYYAVRDEIRYDPYRIDLTREGLSASGCIRKGYGWCVPKAVVLAACCRGVGIPARLGYADVKNHISTQRLRQQMKTDVFYWHGYTDIFLDGRWVKATPAFNRELCEKFGLPPLEFDGSSDSVFHPFDLAGNKYMEYLNLRGCFADPPLPEILATFRIHYSELLHSADGDFGQEAGAEVR